MAEKEFILEHPLINITNIIWSFDRISNKVNLLLVKRASEPYQDYWALPETYMRADESADEAALRLVREKIGLSLSSIHTEQLKTFTNKNRNPDQRVISLAYMTFLPEKTELKAGYGATDAKWFTFGYADNTYQLSNAELSFASTTHEDELSYYQAITNGDESERLAFDHTWIWTEAVRRIRNKLNYQPNILLILGERFTLKEARQVFASFLQVPLTAIDNSNFKKNHVHLFTELGFSEKKQLGRPAKVYRLNYL